MQISTAKISLDLRTDLSGFLLEGRLVPIWLARGVLAILLAVMHVSIGGALLSSCAKCCSGEQSSLCSV
jgi:hypothetical protein